MYRYKIEYINAMQDGGGFDIHMSCPSVQGSLRIYCHPLDEIGFPWAWCVIPTYDLYMDNPNSSEYISFTQILL